MERGEVELCLALERQKNLIERRALDFPISSPTPQIILFIHKKMSNLARKREQNHVYIFIDACIYIYIHRCIDMGTSPSNNNCIGILWWSRLSYAINPTSPQEFKPPKKQYYVVIIFFSIHIIDTNKNHTERNNKKEPFTYWMLVLWPVVCHPHSIRKCSTTSLSYSCSSLHHLVSKYTNYHNQHN